MGSYLDTTSGHWSEVSGNVVPSLTTMIQGGGPKPPWILRFIVSTCVHKNYSYDDYVKDDQSEALRVGTTAHQLVESLLNGEEVFIEKDHQVQRALTCFIKWYEQHKPKIVAIEEYLECDKKNKSGDLIFPFVGTADFVYEDNDGALVLADFKTSKQLDNTMGVQLSGYKMLWDATHDRKIDKLAIIHLKKSYVGSIPRATTKFHYEYDFDPYAVRCVNYLFNLHHRNTKGEVKPTYKPNLLTEFKIEL